MRHRDIKMTQRYTNLVTGDILASHRAASPLDKLTY